MLRLEYPSKSIQVVYYPRLPASCNSAGKKELELSFFIKISS